MARYIPDDQSVGENKYRLTVPHVQPRTNQHHMENWRALERWADSIPLLELGPIPATIIFTGDHPGGGSVELDMVLATDYSFLSIVSSVGQWYATVHANGATSAVLPGGPFYGARIPAVSGVVHGGGAIQAGPLESTTTIPVIVTSAGTTTVTLTLVPLPQLISIPQGFSSYLG